MIDFYKDTGIIELLWLSIFLKKLSTLIENKFWNFQSHFKAKKITFQLKFYKFLGSMILI